MKHYGLLLLITTVSTITVSHAESDWLPLGYSEQQQVSLSLSSLQYQQQQLTVTSKWQTLNQPTFTLKQYAIDCLSREYQIQKLEQHSPYLSISTTQHYALQSPQLNSMQSMLTSTACLLAHVQAEHNLTLNRSH